MDKVSIGKYLNEVRFQCGSALWAWEMTKSSVKTKEVLRIYWYSQMLINSAAMVSKLLLGVNKPKNPVKKRAATLRKALGDLDLNDWELSKRTVRDSLEHYDERLDKYIKANPNMYVDLNIGSNGILIDGVEPQKLRHINTPGEFIYEVMGDQIDIEKVVNELNAITDLVDKWFVRNP